MNTLLELADRGSSRCVRPIDLDVIRWVGEEDGAISLREPSPPMNRATLFGVSLPSGWVPTIVGDLLFIAAFVLFVVLA